MIYTCHNCTAALRFHPEKGLLECGACGSVGDLFSMEFNHHPKVECGILEEACAALLTDFFAKLRVELRSRPKWKPREKEPLQ